ncbi:hypothetical protein EELLY_v1c05980 [Entomoplasma ellychniae]|uniref:Uncharacterized protein n=1 Tax=Entomoplasma ellychniae TaxID=2114 RepID=A0A8E2QWE1_9MOLU|nr:hypothetical protein EELLY_v1c05980 [Entomoplasma ellychniae]
MFSDWSVDNWLAFIMILITLFVGIYNFFRQIFVNKQNKARDDKIIAMELQAKHASEELNKI